MKLMMFLDGALTLSVGLTQSPEFHNTLFTLSYQAEALIRNFL